MSVEYIKERAFLQEVEAAGRVWVAKSALHSIHVMELDEEGYSLPIWSNRERVEEYLKNARLTGPRYEPHAVSLRTFVSSWLPDKSRGIGELQLNPDGRGTRVLCLTPQEFQESRWIR